MQSKWQKGLAILVLSSTLAAGALLTAVTARAASSAQVELWRMDCGHLGKQLMSPDSCYLIRHGKTYVLFDTGLNSDLAGKPPSDVGGHHVQLLESLPQQLEKLGLKPRNISIVVLSHLHFDHVGGAKDFPRATLMLGRKDYDTLLNDPTVITGHPKDSLDGIDPWIDGTSRKVLIDGDRDIFGDGTLVMLNTPGHTPGHHSLLVKLHHMGTVILAGDLYHSINEYNHGIRPQNTVNPAASAASDKRIKALVAKTHATVIITHEPLDIGKLPTFPNGAT